MAVGALGTIALRRALAGRVRDGASDDGRRGELRLVDSGRHPAAWAQAAPLLRKEAGPVEWQTALRAVRAPLGRCYWRTLRRALARRRRLPRLKAARAVQPNSSTLRLMPGARERRRSHVTTGASKASARAT